MIKAAKASWERAARTLILDARPLRYLLRFLVTRSQVRRCRCRRRRRGGTRPVSGPARPTVTEFGEDVRERRSRRLFLRDKPVPRELRDEALSLPMRAPSNSKVQPGGCSSPGAPPRPHGRGASRDGIRRAGGDQAPPGDLHPAAAGTRRTGVRLDGHRASRPRRPSTGPAAQLGAAAGPGRRVNMHRDRDRSNPGAGSSCRRRMAVTQRGLGACVQVSNAA